MADDYITLPEYAKLVEDPFSQGVVETFASASDILQTIGFKSAPQGKYSFNREASLPSMGFRALREEPDISHATYNDLIDQCYPLSGLLDYDRIYLKRYGESRRVREISSQMKAGAAEWTDTFFDGDNDTQPREFTGIKARLTGVSTTGEKDSRILVNDNASGGGPLSLTKLDIALELTPGATHIIMNRRLLTRFIQAARDIDLTGHIIQMKESMGEPIVSYAGKRILTGYEPDFHTGILPFTETGNGGGSAVTSSIYVVRFGDGYLSGIQTAPMEVMDVGHTDKGVFMRDLVEWDCGITMEHPYSALRLSSITDAAIVA